MPKPRRFPFDGRCGPRSQHSQLGRIYVVWAQGTWRFKIGFTAQSGDARCAQIEANSPFPIRILAYREGTRADEALLHYLFRKFRAHREWFELPEEAVWALVEDYMGVDIAAAAAA